MEQCEVSNSSVVHMEVAGLTSFNILLVPDTSPFRESQSTATPPSIDRDEFDFTGMTGEKPFKTTGRRPSTRDNLPVLAKLYVNDCSRTAQDEGKVRAV